MTAMHLNKGSAKWSKKEIFDLSLYYYEPKMQVKGKLLSFSNLFYIKIVLLDAKITRKVLSSKSK